MRIPCYCTNTLTFFFVFVVKFGTFSTHSQIHPDVPQPTHVLYRSSEQMLFHPQPCTRNLSIFSIRISSSVAPTSFSGLIPTFVALGRNETELCDLFGAACDSAGFRPLAWAPSQRAVIGTLWTRGGLEEAWVFESDYDAGVFGPSPRSGFQSPRIKTGFFKIYLSFCEIWVTDF